MALRIPALRIIYYLSCTRESFKHSAEALHGALAIFQEALNTLTDDTRGQEVDQEETIFPHLSLIHGRFPQEEEETVPQPAHKPANQGGNVIYSSSEEPSAE